MNEHMSQVGVAESYIPGLEEIADDFIKLCKDHILDKNNLTPDNFIKSLYVWAVESIYYILLETRLGVTNHDRNFYLTGDKYAHQLAYFCFLELLPKCILLIYLFFRNLLLNQSTTKAGTVIEISRH